MKESQKKWFFFVWYRDPITGKGKWTRNMTFEQWKKATAQKDLTAKTVGRVGLRAKM
ncbi:hypothetical protein [Lactobacillus helveticus]|uniref:hypothetical protein n=1 Tax=Lactobacillus helveticus TaxID=1587 RepID=UPI0021A871EF|nr:hypothetical protein [Lactobacillus helveticus]